MSSQSGFDMNLRVRMQACDGSTPNARFTSPLVTTLLSALAKPLTAVAGRTSHVSLTSDAGPQKDHMG